MSLVPKTKRQQQEPEPESEPEEDNFLCHQYSKDETLQILLEGVINKCTKKFKSIALISEIGRGAYGIVYLAKDEHGYKYAIKYIYKIKDSDSQQEYRFTQKMSDLDIGPKLYEGFYFSINGTSKINQILIMELFDDNCRTVLTDIDNEAYVDVPLEAKEEIVTKMIDLVDKMVDNGIVCFDIKLDNFVARFEDATVRMIDFGEFCKELNPNMSQDDRDALRKLLLLQLKYSTISMLIAFYDEEQYEEILTIEEIFSKRLFIEDVEYERIGNYLNLAPINKSFTHNTLNIFIDSSFNGNVNEVNFTIDIIQSMNAFKPTRYVRQGSALYRKMMRYIQFRDRLRYRLRDRLRDQF